MGSENQSGATHIHTQSKHFYAILSFKFFYSPKIIIIYTHVPKVLYPVTYPEYIYEETPRVAVNQVGGWYPADVIS